MRTIVVKHNLPAVRLIAVGARNLHQIAFRTEHRIFFESRAVERNAAFIVNNRRIFIDSEARQERIGRTADPDRIADRDPSVLHVIVENIAVCVLVSGIECQHVIDIVVIIVANRDHAVFVGISMQRLDHGRIIEARDIAVDIDAERVDEIRVRNFGAVRVIESECARVVSVRGNVIRTV